MEVQGIESFAPGWTATLVHRDRVGVDLGFCGFRVKGLRV